MLFLKWELYKNMQSSDIDEIMKAEDVWRDKLQTYKKELDSVKNISYKTYTELAIKNFHDYNILKLEYKLNGLILYLKHPEKVEKQKLFFKDVNNISVKRHESISLYNSKYLGGWLVHEIIIENGLTLFNLLLDTGIEINIMYLTDSFSISVFIGV